MTSSLNLAYDRNSRVHSAIGTPSRINALRLIVSTRFQVLFHSPFGVLFTFPSRYWFTIGHWEYLALRDGSPGFQRNFTCSAVLRIHFGGNILSITGLLPSLADLSRSIHLIYFLVTPNEVSYNPDK